MASTECTSGQQAFAGAYVLLGSLFALSVSHELIKLIHRYSYDKCIANSPQTPTLLFRISLTFIIISIITLIKCITYGLVHCNYITLSESFQNTVFQILFQDLYAIQLYFLWIVLLFRLYFTLKMSPFELSKLTIKIYSIIFILLPIFSLVTLSPNLYAIFIVLSFSVSIFITLSIVYLYCYKLIQINRINSNAKDILLSTMTKLTVTVVISTILSFIIILTLIFIFIFDVYSSAISETSNVSRQQFLDLCLLSDCYITATCILLQSKYLENKYQTYCGWIHIRLKFYCHKFCNITGKNNVNNIQQNETKQIALQSMITSKTESKRAIGLRRERVRSLSDDRSPKRTLDYHVTSYDMESELGSIPDIPENKSFDEFKVANNCVTIDDIENMLIRKGFNRMYIMRGICVYEKHYGTILYDVAVIEEIIYRLSIKDHLTQAKSVQNLYQSRQSVEKLLGDFNFSAKYINLALLLYEVMAEMFEINKYHENIYDLELITEIIMRLRAKFTEYGDLVTETRQNVYKISIKEEEETEMSTSASPPSSHEDITNAVPVEVRREIRYDTNSINDGAGGETLVVPQSKASRDSGYTTVNEAEPLQIDKTPIVNLMHKKNPFSDIFSNDSYSQKEAVEPWTNVRLSTIRSQGVTFERRMTSLRVHNSTHNNTPQIAMKALRVEQEIIETEKTYLDGLHVLMDDFITPIFDNKLLNPRYKATVICNLPQLIAFHTIFYQQLISGTMSIAQIFNKHSDYFKMYISYVSQYDNILNIFAKNKKNKKLETFLTHKRNNENKSLISYLILPIQRIPRYTLLLLQLAADSNKNEYADIALALKKVKLICAEINEKQRDIENMSQSLLITNKLKGLDVNIVEPQRKYVQLFIFKRKKDEAIKQFFLFNDIVIISDIKWKTEQIVTLTKFEAKRPSKSKNKEVLIRVVGDGKDNAPVSYVCILEHELNGNESGGNENISNIGLFCKLLIKYRSMLYNSKLSMRSRSKSPKPDHEAPLFGDVDSGLVDMIREEQERHELAQWQEDTSKGNKNKVLKMLKSPSEV